MGFNEKKLKNFMMQYEPILIEDDRSSQYQYYVQEINRPVSTRKDQRRPGREPSLPDRELSPDELRRRNNRRRRNREAAARVRERRLGKMQLLEEQVSQLRKEQRDMLSENENLRQQLIKLQKQAESGKPTKSGRGEADSIRPVHRLTRQVSNTEAPSPKDLPQVPKTENIEVFHNDQPTMVCTPGGTFVLTPVRRDVQFSFPETQTIRQTSDSDYKMVLLNL